MHLATEKGDTFLPEIELIDPASGRYTVEKIRELYEAEFMQELNASDMVNDALEAPRYP